MIFRLYTNTYSMSKHKNGFTLIEVLIVILIISILTGFVFYKFADNTAKTSKLSKYATHFVELCSSIRNKALIENNPYGLSIREEGYYWWRLNYYNNNWEVITEKPFAYQQNDLYSAVELFKSNLVSKNIDDFPLIIFYSDSTMTPFKFIIAEDPELSNAVVISTDGVSHVQIE